MRIFTKIDVQVRVLPPQGHPGEAEVYDLPSLAEVEEQFYDVEPEPEIALAVEQPVIEVSLPAEPAAAPAMEYIIELVAEEATSPVIQAVPNTEPVRSKPVEVRLPKPRQTVRRVVVVQQEPEIDWLWYERNPDRVEADCIESEERVDNTIPPHDLWWQRNGQELKTS